MADLGGQLVEAGPGCDGRREPLGGVGGKLAAAAYGIAQDEAMVKDFGPDSKPWLFNSLFASKTVHSPKDSLPGRNDGWIEDFRSLQREQDQRPVC